MLQCSFSVIGFDLNYVCLYMRYKRTNSRNVRDHKCFAAYHFQMITVRYRNICFILYACDATYFGFTYQFVLDVVGLISIFHNTILHYYMVVDDKRLRLRLTN